MVHCFVLLLSSELILSYSCSEKKKEWESPKLSHITEGASKMRAKINQCWLGWESCSLSGLGLLRAEENFVLSWKQQDILQSLKENNCQPKYLKVFCNSDDETHFQTQNFSLRMDTLCTIKRTLKLVKILFIDRGKKKDGSLRMQCRKDVQAKEQTCVSPVRVIFSGM